MNVTYLVQDSLAFEGSFGRETRQTEKEFTGRGAKAKAIAFADSLASESGAFYHTDREVVVYRLEFYRHELRNQSEVHRVGYAGI